MPPSSRPQRSATLQGPWSIITALTTLCLLVAIPAGADDRTPTSEEATEADAFAHWLDRDTLAWDQVQKDRTYQLHSDPDNLPDPNDGGKSLPLDPTDSLPDELQEDFPHLADLGALTLPDEVTEEEVGDMLKGGLTVTAFDSEGNLVASTGLQIPGVLDDLYADAAEQDLGPRWEEDVPSLHLWAPTARSVTIEVFDGSDTEPFDRQELTDTGDGIWSVEGDTSWNGAHYLFEIEVFVPETGQVEHNTVTDPYSVGLSDDGERSVLIDLADTDDPELAPEGWEDLTAPDLGSVAEQAVYELHVRDFSVEDTTVPEEHRGTYRAFTNPDTNGMQHLADLAESGMSAVHLLPVADFGVEPKNREDHKLPECDLAALPPDSEEQQECIAEVAAEDGFNWGYVTEHFTVPEGSYTTDPEGADRTLQMREMVAGLNGLGLRTVMDVVYNHTGSAGQDGANNLDRIVPGYYHRLDGGGEVTDSSCCPDTAAEHTMMNKLIIDSALTWAVDYKVDGFRFDLMGHHPKATMVELREALDGLTVEEHGVDGSAIHLYGEGWNFGEEIEDDLRFEQATQLNMAGTGIGTFDDRLRDAIRGGGCCDEDPRSQGFGSGLYTDPNGSGVDGTEEEQRQALLSAQDRIKVGLSGSLADYTFVDHTGTELTGAEVDHNGEPAGYTAQPQEALTYVSAHDNLTLFDALVYKLPTNTSPKERVRMQTLALSTATFGQGVTFWHAGSEMLRSKSLDNDSYDSGDWFNRYDVTLSTNGFGAGLPTAEKNEHQWELAAPLLADATLKPDTAHITSALLRSRELLQIRQSTPLFHLEEAETVQEKLSFHGEGPDQTPGVIVMRIDDTVGQEVDLDLDGLVVVFNATPQETVQTVPETVGQDHTLHPVQAHGVDDVVGEAHFDAEEGTFTVPARTAAVFVA